MDNLIIVIPFYNGYGTIVRLLESIPRDQSVILIDDLSQESPTALLEKYPNLNMFRLNEKGYFSGAVNAGIEACNTDVLVLNQDAVLEGDAWAEAIRANRDQYALIGERIAGDHPAFPKSYIQGTLMFIRRDLVNAVGLLNARDYPLWGSTCEYQLRACRTGFEALPMRPFPGLMHDRSGRFGSAITEVLGQEPEKRSLFIRTPPEISVIVPCRNYGRYLPDLVNSLCGGNTSLGYFEQQSLASFEVIIVDDASSDDTPDYCQQVANDWKGVFTKRLNKSVGTAAAINVGVQASHGKFISVMGADDMREPWALETLYRVAVERPHNYVYDQILAFAEGQRRPDIAVRVREFNAADLIHKNHVHAGILMPKRAWYECGGYPESMSDGREDWAMNVNLLYNGWCGIFVDSPGYLYRREKQNRTLHNTSREHWQLFKSKIIQMFPELYNGSIDPMSCCGGGRTAPKKTMNKSGKSTLIVAGGAGQTILRYLGKASGKQTFYGPITGARYAAGTSHPLIAVDDRDLYGPNLKQAGMLERVENGIKLFGKEPLPPRPTPIAVPVETPVEAVEAKAEEAFQDWKGEAEPAEAAVEAIAVVDIAALSVAAIKKLELTQAQWSDLEQAEIAGKNRKSVLAFIQGKLNV